MGITSSRRMLGNEDPHRRILELGIAVEIGDAVVGERTPQPFDEPLGEALPLGVERAQVVVEVLAGSCAVVGIDIR